jgi:hypothetical protein
METDREQILGIDFDTQTYTHSCMNRVKESIRDKLEPEVRVRVSI